MEKSHHFFRSLFYILLIIALIVLGLFGFKLYQQTQITNRPANPPTSGSAGDAATRVAGLTLTPGVGSNGQLATEIPWTDSYHLGDEKALVDAIHSLYATKSFDVRVNTVNTYGGVGIYCMAQYLPIPLSGAAYDSTLPMAPQVSNGKWVMLPGSRYCSMWLVMGELWGGVVQSDLQNAPVYTPETKPANIPSNQAWILLTPTDHQTDIQDNRVHEHTQTTSVELHLPFGLLTSSVQPKNQIKKTLGPPPNGFVVELINGVNWLRDKPEFQTVADAADTYGRWLADYDFIAPIDPNGERDMSHLNKLKEQMDIAFNQPTPQGSSAQWPYDNLLSDMTTLITKAGYQQLDSLTVVLEWPNRQYEWVTLESLAAHSAPQPVVKPGDLDFNKDNLYSLFRTDVQNELIQDNIPDWAKSWFHLP